jgi:capsular exopolysaccharide synthesis family protein
MVKLDTSIASAEQRLTAETAKIVAAVRNDYEGVKSRERGLAGALDEQKKQVLSLSQQSIGYAAIQRDAASTQQVFDSILQRVKETDLSSELQTNNARILDVAEVPRFPIWPRPLINLLVALFGGCVAAIGMAIGLEYLNPRITRPDDIDTTLGVPLLGVAPLVSGMKDGIQADALPPIFLEALRGIRTRILLSPVTSVARTLAVTSTNAAEGKTLVASSLAVSMAAAGRRVLLVDADLRRPQQHRIFEVPKTPGLSNVLAGQVKVSDAVLQTATPGLFILPAGEVLEGASDLLESERLKRLVGGFGEHFDLVILDSPPVLAVADASIVGNAVSAVLFVVAAGQTSRDVALLALDRLASVQAYVAGVVLNKFKPDPKTQYYYAPQDYSVQVTPR